MTQSIKISTARRRSTLFFTIATLLVVFSTALTMFIKLGMISDKKESQLLESNVIEMSLTVSNFLLERESDSDDVFLSQTIIDYLPKAHNGESEHRHNTCINELNGEISEIVSAKSYNYNDYFVIYSDSTAVGSVSQSAKDFAESSGYKAYSDMLADADDIWSYGKLGDENKIYYIRRLNERAIFVLSCYTDSLSVLFPSGNDKAAVDQILTDSSGRIIASNCIDFESGKKLPKKVSKLFQQDNEVVIDDYYIAARIRLGCGWQTVSIVENSDYIPNYTIIMTIISIAAIGIIAVCIITGLLAFAGTAPSSQSYAESEYVDAVTGKLNEYGLDEKISDLLETSLIGSTYAFVLIGVIDSERIKSTVTLHFWNDLRLKLANKTEQFFDGKKHYIGRVFDDYIAVLADYSSFDLFKANGELHESCESLYDSFKNFTAADDDSLKLNVCIGVSVYPNDGDDFDTLLGKAREAYKKASESEKRNIAFFNAKNSDRTAASDAALPEEGKDK